jgi:hypothetical protein
MKLGLINVDPWNYLTFPREVMSCYCDTTPAADPIRCDTVLSAWYTLQQARARWQRNSQRFHLCLSLSLSLVYAAILFLLYSSNFSLLSYLITSHLYSPRIMVPPFSFVLFAIALGIVTPSPVLRQHLPQLPVFILSTAPLLTEPLSKTAALNRTTQYAL